MYRLHVDIYDVQTTTSQFTFYTTDATAKQLRCTNYNLTCPIAKLQFTIYDLHFVLFTN